MSTRTPTEAALDANRILERSKAEFESLGIPWNSYEIDMELVAAVVFRLGIHRISLKIGERQYAGVLDTGTGIIGIEQDHHPHRQRFSIAHEIGHFVMHVEPVRSSDPYFCSDQDMAIGRTAVNPATLHHKRREWEANIFAASLLMPEDAVLRIFQVVDGSVRRLASHFKVSTGAMEIRLRHLKLPFSYRS